VDTAAYMAALGLDPLSFLRCSDPLEQAIYSQVAEKLQEIRKIQDHNLAVEIASQVGNLFR